jgi:hypothetical protein
LYLTRVALTDITNLNNSVLHIAQNSMSTLCGRYIPGNLITEQEILDMFGRVLDSYIKEINLRPRMTHTICKHCLRRY